MSFVRKLSFRKKARSEGWNLVNKLDQHSYDSEHVKEHENNKEFVEKVLITRLDGVKARVSESDVTCEVNDSSTPVVVQLDTNNSRPKEEGSIEVSQFVTETNADPLDAQACSDRTLLHSEQSFAIPDGLAMDPVSPTALAVSTEFMERIGNGLTLLRDHGKKLQKYVCKNNRFDSFRRNWRSIVNVVLVEAKDLPDVPTDGSNCVYCKFKLGSETHKSKQASNSKSKPTWCERFNLHVNEDKQLEITVWHKGKQKNFMGRCTIDISRLENEKTHEIWQELECGFGSVHLLVTHSGSLRCVAVDNVPTTNGISHLTPAEDDYSWYQLDGNWSEVGQASVTVLGAKGLSALTLSKADAYCVLELDNSRVQTHTVRGTSEPNWNKSYQFPINDITSTLDITVYDDSIINSEEILGKITIPLLRINNYEKRWYALKNRSRKSSARGNCPRILLQMSVAWNPIKASLRVLSPKENKYTQKPPKFDIPLIYNNVLFIRDIFDALEYCNEHYKRLFEWENKEKNILALIGWIGFLYFFELWMLPLMILLPFLYNWTAYRSCHYNSLNPISPLDDEVSEDEDSHKDNTSMTIKTRLSSLQELTFDIKNGIDYVVSLVERVKNLGNFTVPYLSYLAMTVLIVLAGAIYIIPTRYLFMALGIYKFMKKWLYPERVLNNDLLDFISRVPDDKILKQWRELKVPEPNLSRTSSFRKR